MAAESSQLGSEDQAPSTVQRDLVGRRCRVAGHLATVRWGPGLLKAPGGRGAAGRGGTDENGYAGEAGATQEGGQQLGSASAAPPAAEVVGIEYDTARGKHDGTYDGARLFVCENGYGSFAKLDKVEFGVSFQRAFAKKYLGHDDNLAAAIGRGCRAEELHQLDYIDSKGKEKEMAVTLVGRHDVEKHHSRLEGFVEASLSDTSLETRYPDDVWVGDWSLPNLKSFWLSNTLLSSWSEAFAICELCPQLEWLSLARARLKGPPVDGVLPGVCGAPVISGTDARIALAPFRSRLRTLVLADTLVTWQDVLALDAAGLVPCLEHLDMSRNQLSEGVPEMPVATVSDGVASELPRRLKSLLLVGNGISDWRVLARTIRAFPMVQDLNLSENLLGSNVDGLAAMAADDTPRRLVTLSLSENKVCSWEAVGALSGYALLDFKLQRNPLTAGENPVASSQMLRQMLVAIMPTMIRLNGSEVLAKEKVSAERAFITYTNIDGHPVLTPLSKACDVAAHAARLRVIHGDVVGGGTTEEAQGERSALVNTLVEVLLRPVAAVILDKPAVKKRLPDSMTVGELKRLSQTVFKALPLPRVRLVLADPGFPFGLPLEDDSRELGFYGIAGGAEIVIKDAQEEDGARAA